MDKLKRYKPEVNIDELFWLDEYKDIKAHAERIVKAGKPDSKVPVEFRMFIEMQLSSLDLGNSTHEEKVDSIASLIRSYTTPRK